MINMRSLIIKDIEMPQKCGQCKLFHAEHPMYCTATEGHRTVGAPYGMPRPDWCPLVEVKEFHSDLIEREEAIKAARRADDDRVSLSDSHIMSDAFEKEIKKIATIIEAERR